PDIRIAILERLDSAAAESSDAWNNAGTGHSAFCELNYTPEHKDGSIEISKAVKIAESFEVSKQFWAYLVEHDIIHPPADFIHSIPHMSFVWGEKNVSFLHCRYDALTKCHLFEGMHYTEDASLIKTWSPLVMEGRRNDQPVAATKMDLGTDVNFGSLTRCIFEHLKKQPGVHFRFGYDVNDIKKPGKWMIRAHDNHRGRTHYFESPFVFIGAGGGSLPLLLKSGIPEAQGYGGFPISGQWLRCTNEQVIRQHTAKVYGLAAVGSPPMSVPHLDTRWIKGRTELLFGPYAGFTTKFLRHGSALDLFKSVKLSNLKPLVSAGIHNIPLTRYLIEQVRLSHADRVDALQQYYPEAREEDWELAIAGYRVQVIKKDEEDGGVLEFGTEVVHDKDGSIAALLGASPGASTAVSIMLDLLKKCFPEQYRQPGWQEKLQTMIPSFGHSLSQDKMLTTRVREYSHRILGLSAVPPATP
ncbi:MAG TPA: malate dehydrogenase (quinone), partial [Flavitalea sp.]|nr:malate dehydrogenase (quinone) [Flavitalea sp.]